MWILLIGGIIFGLIKKCKRQYWVALILSLIIQIVTAALFHSDYGYVANIIRQRTNDGPQILFLFPFLLIGMYVTPTILITRAYRKGGRI